MSGDLSGGRTDRLRVGALAAVSVAMLSGAMLVRLSVAPPYAPRVHVRWVDGLSDAQRTALERELSLVGGKQREGTTWEYDLVDPSPPAVAALVKYPAVEDTHYIDRTNGQVSTDAPLGATLLPGRSAADWIHSRVFDWFVSYWMAALFVSAVWLAGSVRREGRIQSSKQDAQSPGMHTGRTGRLDHDRQ